MVQEHSGSMMVSEPNGVKAKKILYEGLPETESVDPWLTSRLIGIMQSIQTDKFYPLNKNGARETDREFERRQEKASKVRMEQIDELYRQMDESEQPKIIKR